LSFDSEVLIISDDFDASEPLAELLQSAGYQALFTGPSGAERVVQSRAFRIVVVDGVFTAVGAAGICARLWNLSAAPLLVISPISDRIEKIVALEAGADDHLVRPFHDRELIAKVRALVRRSHRRTFEVKRDGRIRGSLNLVGMTLTGPEKVVALTPAQGALAYALAAEPSAILTVEAANAQAGCEGMSAASLRTSIARLRVKLQEAGFPEPGIICVRSRGYSLSSGIEIECTAGGAMAPRKPD